MTIKLDREQRERALALEDEMSDANTFGEYAFELIALRAVAAEARFHITNCDSDCGDLFKALFVLEGDE